MMRWYKIFCSGLIILFLMGMGMSPVAAAQDRKTSLSQRNSALAQQFAYQKKRAPTKNSLVRPKDRREKTTSRNYRQDKARDALKSGRIVSLSVIRQRVRQSFPGKIVDVRLIEPSNKKRPYIYMVKVLRKDGRLLVLKVNAANAQIMSVKGNG